MIGAVVTMAVVGIVMAVIYFGILIVTRSPDLKGALAPLRRKLGR